MYERFTDRARKVMQLANQEAQRFNHEYIGTEHILLGLCKEGSGIAANVLKNLDVDLRKIRLEIEKIVQSGPDMVIIGKLPQTPRAKKVIEYSIEEARKLNHNYVGTEHILLGLCREEEGVARHVLDNLIEGGRETAYEDVYYLLGEDRPNLLLSKQMEEAIAKLDPVEQAIKEAIANQDFETAAKLRDRMKKDTDDRSKEALRQITCVLLGYVKEDYGTGQDREACLP